MEQVADVFEDTTPNATVTAGKAWPTHWPTPICPKTATSSGFSDQRRFGPVTGPGHARWSEAVVMSRRHMYEVRHLGALRLESHQLGNEAGVEDSYGAVAEELAALI